MQIQPFLHGDIPSLSSLQPEGWTDITTAFNFYISSSFCFPIKVILNHKIVGVGTTIIHNDVAWLAHIIVHYESRNKGLGRLITKTLMDSLYDKKCDTIYLIATDLGMPVYKKLGFTIETEYLVFKDMKTKESDSKSNSVVPYHEIYKAQIMKLDNQVSGEDRCFHLEQHFADAFLYLQNNIIEGYYLPTFGEGLVIANTKAAGLELIKQRMATKDNACIPVDNKYAIDFLHEQGYKEIKFVTRMVFGKKRNIQLASIYNRISGSLG